MAAVAAVVMGLVAHLRAATTSDLGSVTERWLTEVPRRSGGRLQVTMKSRREVQRCPIPLRSFMT